MIDKYELIEICLACIGYVVSVIAPEFSIIVGAVIFYSYKKGKQKKNLNILELINVIIIAFAFGYYLIPILNHYFHKDLIPSIGFMLGIFGKILLDYFINSRFVKSILDRFFKIK